MQILRHWSYWISFCWHSELVLDLSDQGQGTSAGEEGKQGKERGEEAEAKNQVRSDTHHLTSEGLIFFSICKQANICQVLHRRIKIILHPLTQTPNRHATNTPVPQEDLVPSHNSFWASSMCQALGCEPSLQRGITPALTFSNSCPIRKWDTQTDRFSQHGKGCTWGIPGFMDWVAWLSGVR